MISKQFIAQGPMSVRELAKRKRNARRKLLLFVYAAVFAISALVLTPLSARQSRFKQTPDFLLLQDDHFQEASWTRLVRSAEATEDYIISGTSPNTSDLGAIVGNKATSKPASEGQKVTRTACNPSSVEEFPKSFLTHEERHNGGFLMHFVVAIYMFVAVAIVCDDFFVPSLELLCDKFNMSEDVAGATFMSAGSSAPEFFTSLIEGQKVTRTACNPSSVEEFPKSFLTHEERHNGGFLMHFVVAIYMFVAVAIVCDDFFVPSLELLCDKFNMSEDVAGATFMSAGSSAPEFFTSLIGVFVSKSDVGVSTIVGSAVFNILCIIGVCALFAGRDTQLTWWPLLRDSSYYLISVITLIAVAYDERVQWWESVILVILYLFYILLMVLNRNMHQFISNKFNSVFQTSSEERQTVHGIALQNLHCGGESHSTYTASKHSAGYAIPSTVSMQDYVISCNDKDILQPKDFADASLRIMLSKNFKPACRMRAAARIIIAARKREAQILLVTDETISSFSQNTNNQITVDRKENEISKDPLPQDEDKDGCSCEEGEGLCAIPSSCIGLLKWVLLLPINLVFFITIPDCRNNSWNKWYLATFFNSIIWISVLSYVMVWMTALIGDALNVPDTVMGVTFLAAGTSIPDCIASLLVARQGLGDMAVSNSIGSNVFDILVGLGFPWFLKTVVVSWGEYSLKIRSRGLKYSVALLFVSVFVTIAAIATNKWKLDRKLGVLFLLTYLVYMLIACLIELNVFANINLPTCS